MIRPPGFNRAAFGEAEDGDPRVDREARHRFGRLIQTPEDWSWAHQVHGDAVLTAHGAGEVGEADALLTDRSGLALTVATADCVPVIIEGQRTAAIVHAGWRGMAKGVVAAAAATMLEAGDRPIRGAIGPSIGPCCYEVGPDVVDALASFEAKTTWGTTSVDLWTAAETQLPGIEVWRAELCTFTDDRFLSHRRDGTLDRQVSVTWLSPA